MIDVESHNVEHIVIGIWIVRDDQIIDVVIEEGRSRDKPVIAERGLESDVETLGLLRIESRITAECVRIQLR